MDAARGGAINRVGSTEPVFFTVHPTYLPFLTLKHTKHRVRVRHCAERQHKVTKDIRHFCIWLLSNFLIESLCCFFCLETRVCLLLYGVI
jgi:hypothetical protein